MDRIRSLLKAEIPMWPFQWANLYVVPLCFMFGGCYRTWLTAQTAFEEFSGVSLSIALVLLWAVCFGLVLPNHKRPAA